MIRLRSHGRGKNYSLRRGLLESSLSVLYRADWPARLWQAFPGACDVVRVSHELPILSPGEARLRIGFVSDLHLGPTTPHGLLRTAFGHLALARVDVLLLGGDYVLFDASPRKAKELAALVEQVPAKRKFAVLGNHDLWTRHGLLERALERSGVEVLVNRSTELTGSTTLVGLDDPWTGHLDVGRALRDVPGGRSLVVLCHSPDGLIAAEKAISARAKARGALYVCGHTHGGHLALPWGPIVVPGIVGKKYPAGLYDLGSLVLYVSRGVGGAEVPFRTWADPEVAVFDLTPPGGSA